MATHFTAYSIVASFSTPTNYHPFNTASHSVGTSFLTAQGFQFGVLEILAGDFFVDGEAGALDEDHKDRFHAN